MYSMCEVINIDRYSVYVLGDVLINTVCEELGDELVSKLSDIKTVVLLSSDPEISGALGKVLERFPDAEVLASGGCIRSVGEILNRKFKSRSVKDGEEILGITFKFTPGFIWPDSMVAYSDGTLFSGHMFSKNIEGRYCEFADEVLSELSIKKVLSHTGEKAFSKLSKPVEDEGKYIAVIYSSNYGYTKEMAEHCAAVAGKKFEVRLADAACDVAGLLENAYAVMIGTPTIDRAIPYDIKKAIINCDSTKLINKPVMVFGSYGWSGEAMTAVWSIMKAMRADVFEKPFRSPLRMSDARRADLTEYVEKFLSELE